MIIEIIIRENSLILNNLLNNRKSEFIKNFKNTFKFFNHNNKIKKSFWINLDQIFHFFFEKKVTNKRKKFQYINDFIVGFSKYKKLNLFNNYFGIKTLKTNQIKDILKKKKICSETYNLNSKKEIFLKKIIKKFFTKKLDLKLKNTKIKINCCMPKKLDFKF